VYLDGSHGDNFFALNYNRARTFHTRVSGKSS
jgi:hypothetical protein